MITLRKETKKDFPEISKVNDIAFGRKAESRLIEQLRKKDEFVAELSIVAEVNEQLAGHILFTPIKIESATESYTTLCLAPMSVLPEFQQKSIGKLLVIQGLQAAKDLGFKSVVVLGHPSFYPKFGFKPASKWEIKSPFPAPDEAFMAIELLPNSLKDIHGKVVFPPEFDDL
jgi:putative acetyltransferase